MDNYTATELAYKNGYAAALKEQELLAEKTSDNKASDKKQATSEWISVEERLPEVNKLVLCYKYNASHYRIGFYIGAKYTEDVAAFRNINEAFSFGVTHWMPLPEPPKEADQ